MGKCGMKTEVYVRVVGYMRPIDCTNKGKQEEIRMRKSMDIKGAVKQIEAENRVIDLDDDDSVQDKTNTGKSVFTPDS